MVVFEGVVLAVPWEAEAEAETAVASACII
jgi:hypothetical protein